MRPPPDAETPALVQDAGASKMDRLPSAIDTGEDKSSCRVWQYRMTAARDEWLLKQRRHIEVNRLPKFAWRRS